MAKDIKELLGLAGYEVVSISEDEDEVVVGVELVAEDACPHCGVFSTRVHQRTAKPSRVLFGFIGQRRLVLLVRRQRLFCGDCRRAGRSRNVPEDDRGNVHPSSPPHLRPWHLRRVSSVPTHVLAAVTRETTLSDGQFFFSPQTEEYLRGVTCPALTVRSLRDGLPTAEWDLARFKHPYSAAFAWPDQGHWPHQERPDEFNRILTEWMDGLPE